MDSQISITIDRKPTGRITVEMQKEKILQKFLETEMITTEEYENDRSALSIYHKIVLYLYDRNFDALDVLD